MHYLTIGLLCLIATATGAPVDVKQVAARQDVAGLLNSVYGLTTEVDDADKDVDEELEPIPHIANSAGVRLYSLLKKAKKPLHLLSRDAELYEEKPKDEQVHRRSIKKRMKHLAPYLLLGLGGSTSPSAADVKVKIFYVAQLL
jgi:hypothetical protein